MIFVANAIRQGRGSCLEPTETGEDVASGYAGDPAGNAASFGDGWHRTGDLARLDGTLLRIEGRVDELMNIGGAKVMPAPIEGRLLEIADVVDAGVCQIGQASGVGRLGIGYVADRDIPAGEFADAAWQFSDYSIVRVGHVPRDPMGKIDRSALSEAITMR